MRDDRDNMASAPVPATVDPNHERNKLLRMIGAQAVMMQDLMEQVSRVAEAYREKEQALREQKELTEAMGEARDMLLEQQKNWYHFCYFVATSYPLAYADVIARMEEKHDQPTPYEENPNGAAS